MGAAESHPARRPGALRRLLDERDPCGGPLKAHVMLVHPGPSLLVTAVAVAAGGLLLGAVPSTTTALRIAGVMLPAQLAIGAANDLADRRSDAVSKPHKPIPRGAVAPATAMCVTVAGCVVSIAVAATSGWPAVAFTAAGVAAGLGYDLVIKRSPASVLAWWLGFAMLPVGAAAVAGALRRDLWWCVPLSGLLSLVLLCANALPDIDGDRAAGVRSLPVLVGEPATRAAAALAAVGTVGAVVIGAVALGQGATVGVAVVAYALLVVGLMAVPAASLRSFPFVALASGVLAVIWLATLPR